MIAVLAGCLVLALLVIVLLATWGLHWVMRAFDLEQELEQERQTLRALSGAPDEDDR